MYGLIKKDFLMIKQNLKTLILMYIVFLTLTIANESDVTFMLSFMAMVIAISTFSYDNFNNWDAYAITLSNGRKNAVRAKYISTLGLIIISFLVSILSLVIMNICKVNIDLTSSIEQVIIGLGAVLVMISIMFPFLYKLGVEKGRIVIFLITFLITGLVVLVSNNVSFSLPSKVMDFLNNYYMILIPVILCLILVISYHISKKIYFKKEF